MGTLKKEFGTISNLLTWFETETGRLSKIVGYLGILFSAFLYLNTQFNHFHKQGNMLYEIKATQDTMQTMQSLQMELSKLAIRTTKACYWRADSTGKTVEVGKEAEILTGYTAEELMGFGWFNHVLPADQSALQLNMANTLRTGTDFFAVFSMMRPDSSVVKIRSVAYKVTNRYGKITGYVGTLTRLD